MRVLEIALPESIAPATFGLGRGEGGVVSSIQAWIRAACENVKRLVIVVTEWKCGEQAHDKSIKVR